MDLLGGYGSDAASDSDNEAAAAPQPAVDTSSGELKSWHNVCKLITMLRWDSTA